MTLTPALMARLRKYVKNGDETSFCEVLGSGGHAELLKLAEDAIKLAAKAMTGGNISREDVARLDQFCALIGHQP